MAPTMVYMENRCESSPFKTYLYCSNKMKTWKWTKQIRGKKNSFSSLLNKSKQEKKCLLVLEISILSFSQGRMLFAPGKNMFHIPENESLAWKCQSSPKYSFINNTLMKRTKPNIFKPVPVICIRWTTTCRRRDIKSLIAFTKRRPPNMCSSLRFWAAFGKY